MVFLNKSLLNSSTARRHALTGKGERERRTAFLNLQSSFSASSCSQSFVSFSPSAYIPLGDLHGGGRKFKGASCCSGPYGARQAWGGVFRVPRLGSHRWCNTVFHHNDPRPSKNPRR